MEMIQQVLIKSYAIAKRVGLWSSVMSGPLYARAYYLYKRICESQQRALIRHLARNGSLVVDIGANIGYFTIIMAEAVGENGTVLAFEPDIENLRLMRAAILRAGLKNITVVPAAAGERTGRVPLYVNPDHPGDHRIYPSNSHLKSQDVELWSLDDYLETYGKTHELSLVKIDVQGAELRVLQGMGKALSRHRRAHVLMEFDPDLLRQGGSATEDLEAFLNELGFRPFLLNKEGKFLASSWSQIEGLVQGGRYLDVLLSRQSLNQAMTG